MKQFFKRWYHGTPCVTKIEGDHVIGIGPDTKFHWTAKAFRGFFRFCARRWALIFAIVGLIIGLLSLALGYLALP